jgi:toxin HigB-1
VAVPYIAVVLRITHKDPKLERIERELNYTAEGAYDKTIIRGFRKVMGYLRAATDERAIREYKSLHYEKLQPPRDHQRSVKLSDQWRLILEWEGEGKQVLLIVGIEDYH